MPSTHTVSRRLSTAVGWAVLCVLLLVVALGYVALRYGYETLLPQNTLKATQLVAKGHSQVFVQAQASVQRLEVEMQDRLQHTSAAQASQEFAQLFARGSDGVWRLRPETVDTLRAPTLYLQNGPDGPTPSAKRRAVASYHLLREQGPALVPPFFSAYMDFVEVGLMVYSRGIDWGAAADAQTNNFDYPTMVGSQPNNNPQRKVFWTPVYYDDQAKAWMVSVIKPLDWEGQWVGTVGHDVVIETLLTAASNDHIDGSTQMIVSGDGHLLAHPDLRERILQAKGQLDIVDLKDEMLDAVMAAVQAQPHQAGLMPSPDGRHWLAWAPMDGPDWYVVSVLPQSLIDGRVVQGLVVLFLIGLLAAVPAVALMHRYIHKVVAKPLWRITRAVDDFRDGRAPDPIRLPPTNELGRLAETFNAMAQEVQRQRQEQQQNAQALRAEVQERQLAELKVRELNASLENRVQVRTAELNEAKSVAEAASRAKSEFLATMSHEIRTPMNGVLGMTEMLLSTPLEAPQQRYAEQVLKSGRHLLDIINDILDFSKIESGRLELESADFNLGELLEEAGAMFAQPAQHKGLELVVQLPVNQGPLLVRGDAFRLRQVLANLLSNAIKFTEQGEVVLGCRVLAQTDEHYQLVLSVDDTGVGIPEAARAKVFDKFTQADGSTTRRFGGTGLGLAICKQLVLLMGGRISVDSHPGQGSRFAVELSLSRVSQSPQATQQSVAQLQGVRVLVVDDNQTNRTILREQLSGWGMDVFCVENGGQALAAQQTAHMAQTPYALAILDMDMPDMSGLELAKRWQGQPGAQASRLILLTSAHWVGSSEERRQAGLRYTLSKPVRQADLFHVVEHVLHHDGEGSAALPERPEPLHAPLQGRVLLTEDNLVNQELAHAMLAHLGLRVEIAENGAVALNKLEQQDFDLVLMDCQMPVLDGYEATRALRLREAGSGQHLPVVALTANALAGDWQRCIDAGMDDYLTKPYTLHQLETTLRRWLGQSVTEAERSEPIEPEAQTTLDAQALAQIRELDPDGQRGLLRALLQAYLASSRQSFEPLNQALLSGDLSQLHFAAHTLKSASAQVGAKQLARLCAELEALAVSGQPDQAMALQAPLQAEYERVCRAVGQVLTAEETA